MDFDSSDNSSALPSGKIKTETFKQYQLDGLLKEGKIIPASHLAATKASKQKRLRDFEEAVLFEERQEEGATRFRTTVNKRAI